MLNTYTSLSKGEAIYYGIKNYGGSLFLLTAKTLPLIKLSHGSISHPITHFFQQCWKPSLMSLVVLSLFQHPDMIYVPWHFEFGGRDKKFHGARPSE